MVMMHPDSPLAKLPYITPEDLKGLPLILPTRINVRNELANWFGDEFQRLNVLFTSNLPASSSVMVHNRLAYAIIIGGSISLLDQSKLTFRPLFPELTASSVLAWKRQQPFGLAAKKFIEHIKNSLSQT